MMASSGASAFLRQVADRLPPGRALDVACGRARNALFLLERGMRVVGIDRSRDSLLAAREAAHGDARLLLVQADLESFPLPRDRFDVVLNVRYLQRSLVPALRRAVRPGGVVVFETFLVEQLALGHPRNPDFVLRHGELRRLFEGFEILHDSEGLVRDGDGEAHLARLLARRPA
jgi:SAM-dependent methyltransferase